MSRLRWTFAFLMLCFLAVGVSPAQAADETVPALAGLRTVREQTVLLFNGRPLQVCQREWQSWNRVHGVCQDLATATIYEQRLIEGTTVEFVLFDGQHYERVNDQTTWTATTDPGFAPDVPLQEALFAIDETASVTRVGATEVAGVAAVQYQFWITDQAANEAAGGQTIYDQFLSSAGYVLKSQQSVRGAIAGLGDGELTEIRSYRDFNAPITVAPPV